MSKPILRTEEDKQKYNRLRHEYAQAALTASVYLIKDGGRTAVEEFRKSIAKNCFEYADDMLKASGDFKYE
jgi:hypothetical protein